MNLWHPAPELNQPDIGLGIPEKGELLAWTLLEIHAFTTFDGKRHRCAALQDAVALTITHTKSDPPVCRDKWTGNSLHK